MRLSIDGNAGRFRLIAHERDWVQVNDTRHRSSFVLTPERILPEWPVRAVEDLDDDTLTALVADAPEVILLGTGERLRFPGAAVASFFARHGLGVEFMDNGAACRTYAVLTSEDRRVALGLILPQEATPCPN
jgi:uncharacterized protein